MRSPHFAGAAALLIGGALAGALPAEARGVRFSGFRSHHGPIRAAEPVRARTEASPLGGLTLRLGPETAARTAAATAAVAAPVALTERGPIAAVVPAPPAAPFREARAKEPYCPSGRLVGGSQDAASGFCLIN
ncbi:hypothetical protein U8607_11630 [Methylobacterium durans]|uniref:hypothetical protein n=1 Tax=Methylobacterium durans TaxID=2202825 RepID=UPI002AFE2F8C|nr:hypothetical protein [Methylobacterium durans]MEA1832733.1 hypothetical protein [Methylobacterium durans]